MEGAPAPNEKLEEARQQMQALAVQAGHMQRDCGLDLVPAEFCKEVLKFGLLEVMHQMSLLPSVPQQPHCCAECWHPDCATTHVMLQR